MYIELSECYHCTQLYWWELTKACPSCGSGYLAYYEEVEESESDTIDFIIVDRDFFEKLRVADTYP